MSKLRHFHQIDQVITKPHGKFQRRIVGQSMVLAESHVQVQDGVKAKTHPLHTQC